MISAPVRPVTVVEVSVALALVATVAAVWRTRQGPAKRPFLGFLSAVAALAVTNAAIRNLTSVAGVTGVHKYVLLIRLVATICVAVTLAWFVFVLVYTGREALVTWETLAVVAVPAAVFVAARWLPTLVDPGPRLSTALSFVGFLTTPLVLSLGLVAAFVLLRAAVAYDHLPNGLAVALTAAGVLGSLLFLATGVTAPAGQSRPLLAGGLGVVTVAVWVALGRYPLFQVQPGAGHLGRERAVSEMRDGVVVADGADRVVELNAAAEAALGVEQTAVIGRPVPAVLGIDVPTAHAADGALVVTPADGSRSFELTRSSLRNRERASDGHVYRLQDVTERRRRERRLAVLTGVLRHALDEGMTGVAATARAVQTGETEPAAGASAITTEVERLSALGRTARTVERAMADGPAAERVDLAAVVRAVAQDTPGPVSVDAPATCHVEADPTVLEAVVETVLSEAVERAGEEGVAVAVSESDSSVPVSVTVVGTPLDATARSILEDGAEAPPRDPTGLGLWFVDWGVDHLGGDVRVADRSDGDRVTLTLPLSDDTTGDGEVRHDDGISDAVSQ